MTNVNAEPNFDDFPHGHQPVKSFDLPNQTVRKLHSTASAKLAFIQKSAVRGYEMKMLKLFMALDAISQSANAETAECRKIPSPKNRIDCFDKSALPKRDLRKETGGQGRHVRSKHFPRRGRRPYEEGIQAHLPALLKSGST